MTTLLIDDELGRQAALAAADEGKTLDEFVGEILKQALKIASVRRTTRNGLPVIEVTPPISIDPRAVRHAIEEDGF